MVKQGVPLLDKNSGLKEEGESKGVDVDTYQFALPENNSSPRINEHIRNNLSEAEMQSINREYYGREKYNNFKGLLDTKQLQEYFSGGSDEKIQDRLQASGDKLANIVILNLGTGSFLDLFSRHGAITVESVANSLSRDYAGIREILNMIQANNRKYGTNTQVYLCGAPRVLNTAVTDIFMNSQIKRIAEEYANVTYVSSIPRQPFYKSDDGKIIPDVHYNETEYLELLAKVEKNIVANYKLKDMLIDLDRELHTMSDTNDFNGEGYTIDDALELVDMLASKYANEFGSYNDFIKAAATYVKRIYPFELYRLSENRNMAKDINQLRK